MGQVLNLPVKTTDPEQREYFRFHRKRLAFLLETIRRVLPRGDGVRLLDVGRTPVTGLIRAAFPGLIVHTLGFGGTPEPDHFPWDLNEAQHRQCWPKIGPYDVIVLAEVIEHLHTAPTLVLASMASLLAPSGVLVLQTPNAVSLAKRIRLLRGENPFEMIRETPDNPGHFREYTLDELRGVAAAAGLRVSMVARRNYFDPPGWRNRLYHRICDFMPERLREGITACLVHGESPH